MLYKDLLKQIKNVEIFYSNSDNPDNKLIYVNNKNNDKWLNYINKSMHRFILTIKFIEKVITINSGLRVLELGADPFGMSYIFKKYWNCNLKFAGCDLSGEDIWLCKNKSKKFKIYFDNAEFDFYSLNLERTKLPFDNNYFDIVICAEIIEHLTYSPSFMLKEINRVTKNNGHFFISTPSVFSLRNLSGHIFNLNRSDKYSFDGPYGRHNREFSCSELINIIEQNNFKILKSRLYNINNNKNILYYIKQLLTCIPIRYIKEKRDIIFIIAEKVGLSDLVLPSYLYRK